MYITQQSSLAKIEHAAEAVEATLELATAAGDVIGRHVSASTSLNGELGVLTMSVRFDTLNDWTEARQKLATDPELDALRQAMVQLFMPGRFVQSQARMLTAPFEPSEPFVSLLSIDVDPLRAREAGAFAVEMVEWMEAAHGHRYHAATNLAGDGHRVHWIGEFSDLDTMAATNDRITADDEYWERSAKAAEYFKGYSSRRVQLHRRLA